MTTVTTVQAGRLGSTSDRLGTIHAVGASSSSLGVGGRAHHGPGMTRQPLHHARSIRLAANPATQIPLEHIEQYSRFKLTPSASELESTANVPLRLLPSTLLPRAENSISARPKNISATRSAPALASVGMVTTPTSTGSRRLSLTLARTGTRHSGRRLSSASSHGTTHSWHGTSGIMANLPTPGMLASLAGAAHYTGNPKYSKQEAIRASFGSKPVVLEDQRKQTVEDVLELFCAHPSLEIFDRSWNPDAVYEDPWTKCVGYKEYAAQWFSLPRVTAQSTTVQYRVLSSTHHPHRIVLDQTQQYTLRYIKRKKTIHSLVFLELDEQGKIIKMEDRWNGEEPPRKWGALWLRRLNGKTAPLFVRVPRPSLERTPTPV